MVMTYKPKDLKRENSNCQKRRTQRGVTSEEEEEARPLAT